MSELITPIVIEGENSGPHLLITGGVHGDEFEPIAAIRRLQELLLKTQKSTPTLRGRVTLVPCVNYEAFLLGARCASDGLDLARTFPGRADGSVTERTAAELSRLIEQSEYYIDLHTGGTEFSIYPLAGYILHADDQILDVQRRMAKAFNLNVVWGTSPALEGRSLSVARDAGVPAVYCEYFGSASCSEAGVEAYVQGCLNVMTELKMIQQPERASRLEHVVEDERPDSGHLQINNIVSLDGYFEAAVRLGQRVEAGTVLGTVRSLHHEREQVMQSAVGGIVLMLRTFPRVRSGSSIGMILETTFT